MHPVQDHTLIIALLILPLSHAHAKQPPRRIQRDALLIRIPQARILLEPIALLRPIHREAHVRARQRKAKQDKLDEKPRPTTTT